jgi:hypothetical protein
MTSAVSALAGCLAIPNEILVHEVRGRFALSQGVTTIV